MVAKFGNQIFMGVLMLILFWQVGGQDFKSFQNMSGAIFFVIVGQLMGYYFGSILTFQLERPVFLREQANNLYSPLPYFISKNMVEFPVSLITPLVQLCVIFWGVGMIHFFKVYLAVALTA